jgi:nicotinate-nucleotide adenylyltransferase
MIGIFGGTFDPIHNGHLRTALDVLEALAMDELRFIPLGQAVHRDQPRIESSRRVAMIQAAITDQPGFVLDERELQRETPSYSVNTLESLREELGEDLSLCLLLGRDAFQGFAKWRLPGRILELAHLVVMDRPGYALPTEGSLHELMSGHLAAGIRDLQQQPAGKILFQPVTRLDISSSDIRKRLTDGNSIRYLVPDAVLNVLLESD